MIHLTIQQLSSYHDGELAGVSAESARQHLAMCEACAGKLVRLSAQVESLAKALESRADDALHERIARAIEERIRAERPKAAPAAEHAATDAPAGATAAPAPARATPAPTVPPPKPRVEVPRSEAPARPNVPPVAPAAALHAPAQRPAAPTGGQVSHAAPTPKPQPPAAQAARPVPAAPAPATIAPAESAPPDQPDEPAAPKRPSGASHRRPISTSVWAAAAVVLIVAGVGVSIPAVRRHLVDTRLPEPRTASNDGAAAGDTSTLDAATAPDVAPAPEDSYPAPLPGQAATVQGPMAAAPSSTTATPSRAAAQAPRGAAAVPPGAAGRSARQSPPTPTPARAAAGQPASADDSAGDDSGSGASSGGGDVEPVPIRADDALAGVSKGHGPDTGDPYAHLDARARGAVKKALQLGQQAVNDLSVDGFDAAAAQWERTLPLLSGHAYLAASLSLAEARYNAWQLSSGAEHASAAIDAIRSYIALAPPGSDRDRALSWLTRMGDAGYH